MIGLTIVLRFIVHAIVAIFTFRAEYSDHLWIFQAIKCGKAILSNENFYVKVQIDTVFKDLLIALAFFRIESFNGLISCFKFHFAKFAFLRH